MSSRDDNSRPLGICHRLISFIINNLIGQGQKRVALDGAGAAAPPCESIEVPIANCGSSRNIKIRPSRSDIGNGASSSEVVIDFRHVEEDSKHSTSSVQKSNSQVVYPKKNGFISTADQALLQQGKERRRSDARVTSSPLLPNAAKGKEKYNPTETTSESESEEGKRNINQKAETFIRSRKEAMTRSFEYSQES